MARAKSKQHVALITLFYRATGATFYAQRSQKQCSSGTLPEMDPELLLGVTAGPLDVRYLLTPIKHTFFIRIFKSMLTNISVLSNISIAKLSHET